MSVAVIDASTGSYGRTAVSAAGTAVQLTTSTSKLSTGVVLRALSTNTGKIYVGFDNAVSSSTGYELSAGEAIPIEINVANGVWINASVNGEGVCFLIV